MKKILLLILLIFVGFGCKDDSVSISTPPSQRTYRGITLYSPPNDTTFNWGDTVHFSWSRDYNLIYTPCYYQYNVWRNIGGWTADTFYAWRIDSSFYRGDYNWRIYASDTARSEDLDSSAIRHFTIH